MVESVMLTVASVLLLVMLLSAMGVVGALLTAGAGQIVDEMESRESQRSDETVPGSSLVSSQRPIAPGKS
jgi:hypothetical protein